MYVCRAVLNWWVAGLLCLLPYYLLYQAWKVGVVEKSLSLASYDTYYYAIAKVIVRL